MPVAVFLPLFLRKDDAPLAHPLPCQELSPSRVRSSSGGGTGAAASFCCDSEAAQCPLCVTVSPAILCWCCHPTSASPGGAPGRLPRDLHRDARYCSLWDFRDPLNFSLNKDLRKTLFSLSILTSRASNLLKVPKRKMSGSTFE